MARIGHAVVIGASVAGLAAGAAISGQAERVTVVDRDVLPDQPRSRKGTPQARHLHSLMASGQHALEALLPGVLTDLIDLGAVPVSAPEDNLWLSSVGWCTRFPGTHTVPSASRDLLDWTLRQRVTALPGIRFTTGADVTAFLTDSSGATVTGVRVRHRDTGVYEDLNADLVVDSSGRGTRTPHLLSELGYDLPRRSVVDSRAAYSSRFYRIPDDFKGDWRCISIGNEPPRTTRGGALIQIDGDRWLVSLFGYLDDHPPTDEEGFLEFARSLRHPVLYDTIRDAEPAGPIHGFAHMANQRWHYEELDRWPDGLLVLGDAACTLNPVYAQGMSVAAMSAVTLRDLLRRVDGRPDCAEIQRAVASTVDLAWTVAVGADHALLSPADDDVDPESRRIGEYMNEVLRTALVDAHVNKVFFDVMMMVEEPARLFAPDIAERTTRGPGKVAPDR